MSAPLTTREGLAKELRPIYLRAIHAEHNAGECECGGECFRESDIQAGTLAQADALLASRAIIDAGALVEDESLVEAVHERYFDVDMETCRWWGQRRDVVRGFRALAAALSAR